MKYNNKNVKQNKMQKQHYLDMVPEDNKQALTQELLRGLNKTSLTNIKRSIGMLMKLAYKTQYRELSLQEISDIIDMVEVLNME